MRVALLGDGSRSNPGIVQEFRLYLAEERGKKDEIDRHHRQNTTRLNVIIAILTVLALYIAIVISLPRTAPKAVNANPFASSTQQLALAQDATAGPTKP